MATPKTYATSRGLSPQQINQALSQKYTNGGRPVMAMSVVVLIALLVLLIRFLMILVNQPTQMALVAPLMVATFLIKGWCWNRIYLQLSFVPDWIRVLMVGCGGAITYSLAGCPLTQLASWCHYSIGFDALVMLSVHPMWGHALDAYYLRQAVISQSI